MSFNPSQPRVPAGSPDGGQFAGSMGGASATQKHALGEALQHNLRKPLDAKHSALLSKLGGGGKSVRQVAAALSTREKRVDTATARRMLDKLIDTGHAELGKLGSSGTKFRQRKSRPSMQSSINKLNSFYNSKPIIRDYD